jgi:hypothetical protein
MSKIQCLLQMFDETWSHQCESLRSILRGVSSEESLWQSSAYAAESPMEGHRCLEQFAGTWRISNTVPDTTLKFFVTGRLRMNPLLRLQETPTWPS